MNPSLKLAHYVVNTNKVVKMRDWYSTVLNAEVVFENDMMCFITYDDEHHRLAFMTPPGGATEKPINSTGLMHAAFTFPNLRNLLEHYTHLKSFGITPQVPVQHGPTTSLYYPNPDGAFAELQVDNFTTAQEATDFMHTQAYADDPLGPVFDPQLMLDSLDQGVPEQTLTTRAWAASGPDMPHPLALFAAV
mgnify:FL=1